MLIASAGSFPGGDVAYDCMVEVGESAEGLAVLVYVRGRKTPALGAAIELISS